MKAKQLIDICKNNWPAKAICFGIAIFLYVFFQIKSLGHAEFNVELSVETSNGMVQASPVYNGSNHSRTVKIIAHGMPASPYGPRRNEKSVSQPVLRDSKPQADAPKKSYSTSNS